MTRCVLVVGAPLVLLAAGCLEEPHSLLVAPGSGAEAIVARSLNHTVSAPATEVVARRVIAVGRTVVAANPQLGMRPLFLTVGTPLPEIFHKGVGGLSGCQVTISEGLVNRCVTEGQLAAVLCHELGKVIAEREAVASADPHRGEKDLPPDVPVGNDAGGAFGSADGTRMMELAKLEKDRRKPGQKPLLPSPEALAQQYLTRAGFEAGVLEQVRPLLSEAEKNFNVEKGWKSIPTLPPGPLAPAPLR